MDKTFKLLPNTSFKFKRAPPFPTIFCNPKLMKNLTQNEPAINFQEGSCKRLIRVYSLFNTEVSGLNTEVSGLNTEVSGFNTEVSGLNTEVSGFNTEVSGLNTEVSGFKLRSLMPLKAEAKWQNQSY